MSNSEANVVIAQKNTINKFVDKCILIDIEDPDNYSAEDSDLPNINMPNDLIYVIYTSGTTGNPKGVMIEHRNLVNVMFSWIKHYELDSFEVKLLQLASMSFDVFAGDLCRSLFTGGTMYICPNDVKLDFDVLYSLINERKINIFESTPSFVIAFMDYIYENRLEIDSIKLLILGSDTCPIDQYKALVERYGHKMRVINSYGITEATIDSSYYEGDLEDVANLVNVPIGKPLNNTEMYILNSSLKLQPIGVYGELYIGGDSIARGYFKNEELTKQKFIDNPFVKDEKMYRTGDLARWLPDGNIEFLGRADYQVKIRGFRVEIKEIESILSNYNSIKQAIVIDKEDMNKTKYLCAYVVSSEEIVQQDIRRYLGEKLPEYMIPSYFVTLDKLPLTPNGKVDRRALPEPQSNVIIGNEYVAPTTSIEKKLQSIWQDVLGVEKIGIFDNFFELGGHSLKAISLASRINKGLDVVIPLKEIFKAPTISSLGKYIEQCEISSYTTIESISKRDHYETSMAQKRMYILQQLDMESTGYNMSGLIEIKGRLNKEKLEESFKNLVSRHEALRTYFVIEDGEIVQKDKRQH